MLVTKLTFISTLDSQLLTTSDLCYLCFYVTHLLHLDNFASRTDTRTFKHFTIRVTTLYISNTSITLHTQKRQPVSAHRSLASGRGGRDDGRLDPIAHSWTLDLNSRGPTGTYRHNDNRIFFFFRTVVARLCTYLPPAQFLLPHSFTSSYYSKLVLYIIFY